MQLISYEHGGEGVGRRRGRRARRDHSGGCGVGREVCDIGPYWLPTRSAGCRVGEGEEAVGKLDAIRYAA